MNIKGCYCTVFWGAGRQLFGDGLQWAGLAIVHLLGQRPQLELFDYASYTTEVIKSVGGEFVVVGRSPVCDESLSALWLA